MEHDKILDILTLYMTDERLNHIIAADEEYQAAKIHEQEAYEKLRKTLTKDQMTLLENFTIAAMETGANIERISYQQGFKDMFIFFKELSE